MKLFIVLIFFLHLQACTNYNSTADFGEMHAISISDDSLVSYSKSFSRDQHETITNISDLIFINQEQNILNGINTKLLITDSLLDCELFTKTVDGGLSQILPTYDFFNGMNIKLNLIVSFKKNLDVEYISSHNNAELYFLFNLSECTDNSISDLIISIVSVSFHEIAHIYLGDDFGPGSNRVEEYFATKYGLCALLDSEALKEISFTNLGRYKGADDLFINDPIYRAYKLRHMKNSILGRLDAWYELDEIISANNKEIFSKKKIFEKFCRGIIN
jgi:hypothetical protein